jgi:8-oxo-dGTP pyrophosphatase MutT (NUDIX family)
VKRVTLLFLRKDNQILLAMKKRGFGADMWNGVGGKVDSNETIEQAAIRECYEEIGVVPHSLKPAGYLQFLEPKDPTFEHRCYIFTTQTWDGEPVETEEMRPQWFDATKIPYPDMWPADTVWMPHLLADELFAGTVRVSRDRLLSHDVRIVPKIQVADSGEPL